MPDKLLSADANAGQLLSADPSAAMPSDAPMRADHPILAAIGAASGVSLPIVKAAIEELATNPNVPRLGAKIGRFAGAVAPPLTGAIEAGPLGFFGGLLASSKSAWAGGKTGWFTAKLAQNVAAPVAKAISAIEPYMPALAALAQEGDTLGRINSPESVASLVKTLKPEHRYKLMAFYRDKPDYMTAIRSAIGMTK